MKIMLQLTNERYDNSEEARVEDLCDAIEVVDEAVGVRDEVERPNLQLHLHRSVLILKHGLVTCITST